MKYVKGLDSLRFIAVILVVRNHWGFYTIHASAVLTFILTKIVAPGAFAVDMFFVLSGFLITNILVKAKNEAVNSRGEILRSFMARRILRIFPVYYACIIVLFLLNYPGIKDHFVYLMTYTENFYVFKHDSWNRFSHTWTLAVEEQFYLLWPFVILFTPNRYLLGVIIFFIAGSTAANFITTNYFGQYVLPFNCYNAFAIGAMCSYGIAAGKTRAFIISTLKYLFPVAVLLYLCLQMNYIAFPPRIVYSIIAINIILYIVEEKYGSIFSAIINNKILVQLGKVSYGMYLFHYCVPYYYPIILNYCKSKFIIAPFLLKIITQPTIVEVIEFIVLIIISLLSYYLFESQFLKLKRYFKYNDQKKLSAIN